MKYVDFDVVLTTSGEGYRAEVVGGSSGPVHADFRLPFTEQELKIFRLEAAQSRRGVRRMESSDMRAAREFGGRLYEAVFSGELRERFARSLDDAESASSGLRVRMHLSRAPELASLPWEYLYDPALGRFFSLSVSTPLVRFMDLPERIKPLPVKPPVRVLVVIASPKDKPPLDVEGEWTRLSAALSGLTESGMVELDRLPTPSYAALLKRLRQKPYHIFHFVGHGEFNDECKEGVLLFEDERGQGCPISAQALGTLLHDQPSLRLAILNSCEGARTSSTDPFSGTAQTLLQQGIPAVIAMQAAITDEAAQTLAYTFYDAIADGYPVDAALTDARKSIFGEGSVEFGTPVLYMRSPDGRIFDVDRLSTEILKRQANAKARADAPPTATGTDRPSGATADPRRPKQWADVVQIADLFHEGNEALSAGDWARAADRFRGILARDPAHAGATDGLERAERGRQQAEAARSRPPAPSPVPASAPAPWPAPAPAPAPAPPSKRKWSLWFKLGGCAVAVTGSVLVIGVVGVFVQNRTSAVNSAAVQKDTTGVNPAAVPTMAGPVAKPGPERRRRSVADGLRPQDLPLGTERAQVEEALISTIQAATQAGIQAYRAADSTPLQSYYTGEALTTEVVYISALAASGQYAVARLGGQEFQGVQVSPDGQQAQVDVLETWSAQLRLQQTGACVAQLPSYPMRQSYFLQRFGDRWLITAIRRFSPLPQRQPCYDAAR